MGSCHVGENNSAILIILYHNLQCGADLKEGLQGTHHWQGRGLEENMVCPRDSQLPKVCPAGFEISGACRVGTIFSMQSEHLITDTTSQKRPNCHYKSTIEVATVWC